MRKKTNVDFGGAVEASKVRSAEVASKTFVGKSLSPSRDKTQASTKKRIEEGSRWV